MADGLMDIVPYFLKGAYTQPSRLNKFDHDFLGHLDRQFIFFFHGVSPVPGLHKTRLDVNCSDTGGVWHYVFWNPAEQKKAIKTIQRGSR